MWIELPTWAIFTLNCLGIPAVHLLVSWWTATLPHDRFAPARGMFRTRRWERGGAIYGNMFFIRKWKSLLPDGGAWFGGFAKSRLKSRDVAYLQRFQIETCRGEFAHWLQLGLILCFILWTPWPFSLVIVLYGFLSNLPCIMNLRHTRARLEMVLEGTAARRCQRIVDGTADR